MSTPAPDPPTLPHPPVDSGDHIRVDQDAALHRYALGLQAEHPDARILVGRGFNGFQFETSPTGLEQGGSLHDLDPFWRRRSATPPSSRACRSRSTTS